MKYLINIIFQFITIFGNWLSSSQFNERHNFTQLASGIGYTAQEYDVETQDGYILKLFRIPGNKSKPVLLMHGILDSADTFIIRGNSSLAATLADEGYDVWLGNNRGNRYSRRHLYLDPDKDNSYWDFSFHEIGYYDLPAIIDFILDSTGAQGLSAAGHSQGNTIFLVLGATRPDYNQKIKVMISLSPICFLSNLKNTILYAINSVPTFDSIFKLLGEEELFGDKTILSYLFRSICGHRDSYYLCGFGLFFPLAGSDPDELESDFFPTVVAHYPTGSPMKSAVHFYQISVRGTFAEFDYGARNIDIYESPVPPEYDLKKVTMKFALLAGRNDQLSTLRDVEMLRSQLPNVVHYSVLKHKKFNHADGVWGRNMRAYLFPTIFDVLSKHG